MTDIQMPQLGESVTEGTITKWFKGVGDRVELDEVLFEVSTDKVDSEVPSTAAGYVAEIKVPEGETVDVGTVLAVLSDEPGGAGAAAASTSTDSTPEPAEPAEADATTTMPAVSEEPTTEAPAVGEQRPSPPPPPSAPSPPPPPPPPSSAAPPPPAQSPAPAAPASPAPAPAAAQEGNGSGAEGRLMSPVVRKLVTDYSLDLASVTPTGAGGRITRADVQRAIREQAGSPAAAPQAPAAQETARPPLPAPPQGAAAGRETIEPLNNIRRLTAEHMVASKSSSPHAYTIVEVDYENVEKVRRQHKAEWKETEGYSLTYLPFISRAVMEALADYPHLNATMGEGELVVHNYVNLAFAVDLDFEALLAPVIHDADGLRMRAVARSINDLAQRARARKLSVDDITGGTFTISNSGSFGTHLVLPIINQPQVAILSTDGVTRKPVVVTGPDGSEAIAIHSVGMLALSWDHRAFDGAYAAAFLREVKHILETRDWEAEL